MEMAGKGERRLREEDFRLLTELYRTPNMTKAAERLFITQPTLTRRIQQIEKEFRTTILLRSNKGVVFTPQGEYLAAQGEKLLNFMGEMREKAGAIERGSSGRIKIAVANSYGEYTLPALLQQFKALHANVAFDVITTLSGNVLKLVRSNEAEAGIIRGDFSFHGSKKLLKKDQCYIFSKSPIDLMALPLLPMISHPMSAPSSSIVNRWWNEHFSVAPNESYRVGSLSICREMVMRGLGYGISMVEDLDPAGEFYHIPMYDKSGKPAERNTWLIKSDAGGEGALLDSFIDFLLYKHNAGEWPRGER